MDGWLTERKPLGMPAEDWVERQIRQAQERGDFDNLPGAGKPIPQRPSGTMEWVATKLREENIDSTALLPPSLALRKEVENLQSWTSTPASPRPTANHRPARPCASARSTWTRPSDPGATAAFSAPRAPRQPPTRA